MIELYTGTPGSGKSLHSAERIYYYLHVFKCPVIANFEVKASVCRPKGDGSFFYVPNKYLSVGFLYDFSERYRKHKKVKRLKEESILLIVDEAQLIFNSRTWGSDDRLKWIGFFSQHRKLGYRIILVCQYIDMLDKQIRCLIEYEHIHRKVKNIGFFGAMMSIVSLGGLHICNVYHIATNIKVSHTFFKGNSLLYEMYDSYTRFDEAPDLELRSGSGSGA